MRLNSKLERSLAVAVWLFFVAFLILGMVVVGGATRLTGSGLSITEWAPITGAIPPLSHQAWLNAFARYQQIPQYRFVNRGMSLSDFQFIYWWEWTHRLLGRLIGLVFAVPFVLFLVFRRMPTRLIWRCLVLLVLGGLQGFVGWWMVASGLEHRVSVAPERLATHLGLALIVFCGCIWTGLEAWAGRARPSRGATRPWRFFTAALTALIFLQILLGALVAGNHAGLVFNDWPYMNGRLFPQGYVTGGIWATLAHSQAAVQFNHRISAYLIFVLVIALAVAAVRAPRLATSVKVLAVILALAVVAQVGLGISTLVAVVPLSLSIAHQVWAVIVLTIALGLTWQTRRA